MSLFKFNKDAFLENVGSLFVIALIVTAVFGSVFLLLASALWLGGYVEMAYRCIGSMVLLLGIYWGYIVGAIISLFVYGFITGADYWDYNEAVVPFLVVTGIGIMIGVILWAIWG